MLILFNHILHCLHGILTICLSNKLFCLVYQNRCNNTWCICNTYTCFRKQQRVQSVFIYRLSRQRPKPSFRRQHDGIFNPQLRSWLLRSFRGPLEQDTFARMGRCWTSGCLGGCGVWHKPIHTGDYDVIQMSDICWYCIVWQNIMQTKCLFSL